MPDAFVGGAGGLTNVEAALRRERYGPNELTTSGGPSAARQVLMLLASPLQLVLIAASVVAATVGEIVDAVVIVAMVLMSAALGFVQTARSTRAAERLRRSVTPTATVFRDGAWGEISRRELVPGDVIRLTAGDRVPADARLLTSRDLHVQQSALTGESMPAEKEASHSGVAETAAADPSAPDRVFLGTSVVSGTATAIVTATGRASAFGDVVARLAGRRPPTEFERGLAQLGGLITRTVVALVLVLVLVGVVIHRDPLSSLLFALALAVGLVPEFMPVITSVTLAHGASRMARRQVIVKQLPAIQNLGSVDVLCSDKTGTLTRGEMTLEASYDPIGSTDHAVLELAHLNAHFESGIRSPLDDAIERACPGDGAGWAKRDELPFDFERRVLSVVVERNGSVMMVSKGAPEAILARCTMYTRNGEAVALDAVARGCVSALIDQESAKGHRVLAVARRDLETRAAYTRDDEQQLQLAGMLTFSDPPLEDAPEMLARLREDGVTVKILTGDDPLVAKHVCACTGLDAERMVLGTEIEHLNDAALGRLAEQTTLFARVSPAQKNRIILALKARGHVVGYLGDGINDAPSLHSADVGISVASAVAVARDAADVILLERRLDVLHAGIMEGRKAFGNVMKYLLMATSSNFGNMFSMAIASAVLPFLPMLPAQILLNNMLYDVAQVSIGSDNVDDEYVRKPRHWNVAGLKRFMLGVGPVSSLFDFLTFFVLLRVLHAGEREFHTGWFLESLVTQVLVLFVIRTPGNPLVSRPSRGFMYSALVALAIGVSLPFMPFGAALGFVSVPVSYMAFVVLATSAYLLAVNVAKRRAMHWVLA